MEDRRGCSSSSWLLIYCFCLLVQFLYTIYVIKFAFLLFPSLSNLYLHDIVLFIECMLYPLLYDILIIHYDNYIDNKIGTYIDEDATVIGNHGDSFE